MRFVPARQAHNKIVYPRFFASSDNSFFRGAFFTDADIFFNARIKELHILHHNANAVQKFIIRNVPYIRAAHRDAAAVNFVKPKQQVSNSCFSASRFSYQRSHRFFSNRKIDMFKPKIILMIRKTDIRKRYIIAHRYTAVRLIRDHRTV